MYKEKAVNGAFIVDGHLPKKTTVIIRATKDKLGKSISFNCGNLMIAVPVEPLGEIIRMMDEK